MSEGTLMLVFGATSGIAQAVARLFAPEGVRFCLVGRDEERLAAVADDLAARGSPEIRTYQADVGNLDSHGELLSRIESDAGIADIVLMAHGHLGNQAAAEKAFPLQEELFKINFLSMASLLTSLSETMRPRKKGALAVIGSVAGDRGRQSNYIYGTSKAALDSYLEGLRNRLFRDGIHVLTIKPGFVITPMTQHLRHGLLYVRPEKVAKDIRRALVTRKDVLYTPWFWRWIMMGIRFLPRGIFKRLRL